MRVTLALTGTVSADAHREGLDREVYLEVPLPMLGHVKPVALELWPVRVRKGEVPPARVRRRDARKIAPGWIEVKGPIGHRGDHQLVLERCVCGACAGSRLFVLCVVAPDREGHRYSLLHLAIPEVPHADR